MEDVRNNPAFELGRQLGFAEGRAEALHGVVEKLLINQSNAITADELGNLYRASLELNKVTSVGGGMKAGY